jgi:hypothetical protein
MGLQLLLELRLSQELEVDWVAALTLVTEQMGYQLFRPKFMALWELALHHQFKSREVTDKAALLFQSLDFKGMLHCVDKFKSLLIGLILASAMLSCKRISKEREFVQRQIHGVITKLTEDGRDECSLYIKESSTSKVLEYPLVIGRFVKENHIQPMDSIAKNQNSGIVVFFRKTAGQYSKIAELHYY